MRKGVSGPGHVPALVSGQMGKLAGKKDDHPAFMELYGKEVLLAGKNFKIHSSLFQICT